MNFKVLIVIIICIGAIKNIFTTFLQLKSCENKIPANVSDIYDAETYKKWGQYNKEKCRLSFIHTAIRLIIDIIMFSTNLFSLFAGLFPDNTFMQLFAVMLLDSLTGLLTLPLQYYDTIKLEGKYGFNKSTNGTFIGDAVKSFILELLLFTLITWILALLHNALGNYLPLAFSIALFLLIFGIFFLSPFLAKIFNKLTPIGDGEIREKLTALLSKHNIKIREIYVSDASKRSTKAGASFSGLGKTKSIILDDTLIEKFTPDEICAVFAHELGHGLHHDMIKNLAINFLQFAIWGFMVWFILLMPDLFKQYGFEKINYGFSVLVVLNLYTIISPLYQIFSNAMLRRFEYRADATAADEGYGPELISALKKLTKVDFGEVAPSQALIILLHNHPSLSQRISAIEERMKENEFKHCDKLRA